MRRGWKIVLGLLGVLVVVVAGALVYVRPFLLTATGYAAHNACAVTFVAERDGDTAALDVAGEEEAHAAQWWVNERPDRIAGPARRPGRHLLGQRPRRPVGARGPLTGPWSWSVRMGLSPVLPLTGSSVDVDHGTMVVVRMGLSPGIPAAELGVEALVSDVIAAVG